MKYAISIISPDGYVHSRCFEEVALCLLEALQKLGHQVWIDKRFTTIEDAETIIIMGGHLLDIIYPVGEKNIIFYNLEQPDKFNSVYLQNLRTYEVWDYCKTNIEKLKEMGIKAKHCEVGYMPILTRIKNKSVENQDIDVLFYGSLNDRRNKILNELKGRGIRTRVLFGVYGYERDKEIAHSKIVLNLHYHDTQIFEIVRCSFLMANRKCIVSEFGNDVECEAKYYGAINFTKYDNLVWEIERMLKNEETRNMYANEAFDRFSYNSQTEILEKIL